MIDPIPTPGELTGCIPRMILGKRSVFTPRKRILGAGKFPDWYQWIVPTYSQAYDSCVGHGWANWMECMLRRYVDRSIIPANRQLNGDTLWMHARNKHWNGVLKGGIFIPQGFEALVDLGWLPPGALLVEVPAEFDNYNAALAETPLVQGHMVTRGWFETISNGCIAHTYERSYKGGGHCTLGISTVIKDTIPFRGLLNSWGANWGWNGIGLMTDTYWLDTTLDDCVYTVALPHGRDWSELAACPGWKKALISTPH